VIVIAIEGGEPDVAVWGGLMTAGAVANGHAGAVLDGGVRDLTEIRRDDGCPVYARDVSPGTTLGRYRTVASQVPVRVGGIMVHSGDIIVADVDGVVVVPQAHAAEALKLALEIDVRELEQAKLIIAERSLRKGLAKYGRI
jgi:regulator of RNase E activity RraA